jgi:hypothetical protein
LAYRNIFCFVVELHMFWCDILFNVNQFVISSIAIFLGLVHEHVIFQLVYTQLREKIEYDFVHFCII